MNEQIPKYFDKILDEVIPIYRNAMSSENELESDIAKLQGEIDELNIKLNNDDANKRGEQVEKLFENCSEIEKKMYRFEYLSLIISILSLIIFAILFFIGIINPFNTIVTTAFSLTVSAGLTTSIVSSLMHLACLEKIRTVSSKFFSKYNKKYQKLESQLASYSDEIKKLSKIDEDLEDAVWQKKIEIDNKTDELTKLRKSISDMEQKIGRNTIRERAVMFGVTSEVLDFIKTYDEQLPQPEEDGKGQYTLNKHSVPPII